MHIHHCCESQLTRLYATAILGVERALLTTITFPTAICVLTILPNLNCRSHTRALLCVKSAILTIKTFPIVICAPEYNQFLSYIFSLDLWARSMQLMLQATWASGCNLRDSVRRVETGGREKRYMIVHFGGSSGIGGRCLRNNNDLNGSCWMIGDLASVGGEVERAREEDGSYG